MVQQNDRTLAAGYKLRARTVWAEHGRQPRAEGSRDSTQTGANAQLAVHGGNAGARGDVWVWVWCGGVWVRMCACGAGVGHSGWRPGRECLGVGLCVVRVCVCARVRVCARVCVCVWWWGL